MPARPTAPGRALDEITRSCLDKNSGKLNSTFPRITVQQRAQHCCGTPPAVTAAARLQSIVQCNVLWARYSAGSAVTEWLLIRRKLFVHVLNNRAIIRHGFHKGKG